MKIAKAYVNQVSFTCPYCVSFFYTKKNTIFFSMEDVPKEFLCNCGKKSAVPTLFKKAKIK